MFNYWWIITDKHLWLSKTIRSVCFRRWLGSAGRRERLFTGNRNDWNKFDVAKITQKSRKIEQPGEQRCFAELQ